MIPLSEEKGWYTLAEALEILELDINEIMRLVDEIEEE
ncbi:hypothetical protein IIM_04965 [Bacillus cereus VD107]|nr:hypothetical protein IIM_04965 [Bacillus cereus VD107]